MLLRDSCSERCLWRTRSFASLHHYDGQPLAALCLAQQPLSESPLTHLCPSLGKQARSAPDEPSRTSEPQSAPAATQDKRKSQSPPNDARTNAPKASQAMASNPDNADKVSKRQSKRVDEANLAKLVAEENASRSKFPQYPGLERWELLEKMGDGAFSNVYRARDTTGQYNEVAIKVVRKYEMNNMQVSPYQQVASSAAFSSFVHVFCRASCFCVLLSSCARIHQSLSSTSRPVYCMMHFYQQVCPLREINICMPTSRKSQRQPRWDNILLSSTAYDPTLPFRVVCSPLHHLHICTTCFNLSTDSLTTPCFFTESQHSQGGADYAPT